MWNLYGHTNRGFRDVKLFNSIKFFPDLATYYRLAKITTCDAQGNFAFKNVSDGSFYVITEIIWEVPVSQYTTAQQGGGLMQLVTVDGGETKEIVLSP